MPPNYEQMMLEMSGGRLFSSSKNVGVSDNSVEWMTNAMDLEWLSSVPFEMDFESDRVLGGFMQ